MKIVVAGGTGLVGALVVERATRAGHEVGILSRSCGVDLTTGVGVAEAVRGADAVIDVSNVATLKREEAVRFFETATGTLLAAEQAAGVRHHVALSIVGIDRVPTGYYAGKRRQEELVAAGEVPWTVLRATQFHEFVGQVLDRVKGPVAVVPKMRSATVAAREVAAHLVELAVGPARGQGTEMSGPAVESIPDLARDLLQARGSRRRVLAIRLPGVAGREMAGSGLLPTGSTVVGRQTFREWLAAAG